MGAAIISFLSLVDVVLLIAGLYALLALKVNSLNAPVKVIAACVLIVILISYLYYLMLITHAGFGFLYTSLSVANILHFKWSYPVLKNQCQQFKGSANKTTIVLLAAMSVFTFIFCLTASKYGGFDAIYIWNSHAQFLYHDDVWQNLFADKQALSHMDYPLMLSSFVAFLWKAGNGIGFVAPLLFSYAAMAAVLLLLYYALAVNPANKVYAFAGLFILVADTMFQNYSGVQMADIPLALFILLSVVLLTYLKANKQTNLAFLLGFIVASTTWLKNEGILFLIVFGLVFIISNIKNKDLLKYFIAGILLPLAVIVSFKLFFAPNNDVAGSGNTAILIHKLTDISRYTLIITRLIKELFTNLIMGIVLCLLLGVLNFKAFKAPAFVILFLLFCGYCFIYVITPYDLSWHITTSLQRLIYQLYPSFIFLVLWHLADAYPLKAKSSK